MAGKSLYHWASAFGTMEGCHVRLARREWIWYGSGLSLIYAANGD